MQINSSTLFHSFIENNNLLQQTSKQKTKTMFSFSGLIKNPDNYSLTYPKNYYLFRNNISFSGISSQKKEDFINSLCTAGVTGTAFLIGLGVTAALARSQNPEDIFLSDGSYLGNVKDSLFRSEKLNVNATEGVFQAQGTGIDIRPERFDYCDSDKGIYQNYEKGIDIDLNNNKYIDPENGILVDPEHKISIIKNESGEYENVVVPNFKGSAVFQIHGNGDRISYNAARGMTRQEYFNKYGEYPEDNNTRPGIAIPNDNRTVSQKIIDFIKMRDNLYDHTKNYDVFGREIKTITLANGNKMQVAIDENLQAVIDKYDLDEDSIGELTTFTEQLKSAKYLVKYIPNYDLLPRVSMQEMLDNIHSKISEVPTDELLNDIEQTTGVSFTSIPTNNDEQGSENIDEILQNDEPEEEIPVDYVNNGENYADNDEYNNPDYPDNDGVV